MHWPPALAPSPFRADELLPPSAILGATYYGDTHYLQASSSTVTITVNKSNPTFSAAPTSSSTSTNQSLEVKGSVTSPAEAPSGSVTFSSGGYTGGTEVGNTYSSTFDFKIPAGSLTAGVDLVKAAYGGDNFFNSASTSFTVTVAQFTKVAPTIKVSPQSKSIDTGQQLYVAVAISGSEGAGTGSVTLTSGSWNSGSQPISSGTANITIPSSTLPAGTDTLTASYSGDASYLAGTATATVTVSPSSFTVTAGNPPNVDPGQQAEVNVSLQSSNGYTGQVTLTCAVTSQPSGAVDLPTCKGGTIPLQGGSDVTTVLVSTTVATASNSRPPFPGLAGFGGAALAFLSFLGIPARRRGWRNLLGVVVLIFVVAGMGACGGGGGTSGGGGGSGGGSSGTTAGTYTFTVTGTGSPAVSPAPTTTFTLTVN